MRQWQRRAVLLIADIIGLNGAVLLGLVFRFDGQLPSFYVSHVWRLALPYTAIGVLGLLWLGQYRTMFRHADVQELWPVAGAVTLATGSFIVLTKLLEPGFPVAVYVLLWMASLVLVGGIRLGRSLLPWLAGRFIRWRRQAQAGHGDRPRPVIVVGAGAAGAIVVREMRRHPEMGRYPVALLDDDPGKQRLAIAGVPVRGTRDDLTKVVRATGAKEVIFAIPTARAAVLRDVVTACQRLGLPVLTVPGVYEVIGGTVTVSHLRAVELEDLIGRVPVRLQLHEIATYLTRQRVLVTGAAGSIGSELCRQLVPFQPGQLVLFDHDENGLFELGHELHSRFPHLNCQLALADIRHVERIEQVFEWHRPDVVFHAAACKHVPLMEAAPAEAVLTNVIGTRNVAEAAKRHGVDRFVMISTDKAVNPTSVMGATKRVAEMICQSLNEPGHTRFVSVRFGNVLGSRGSVVPIFREQIAQGGPVTVTHPDMQRYFMTIPEAVQLVIQAGAMGRGGEVFVLDMGEPLRIVDLARNLIRLSGLEPDVDIPIVYTGIRPGEKLFEELLTAEEGTDATQHERIFVARTEPPDAAWLRRRVAALEQAGATGSSAAVTACLRRIVPQYEPHPHPGDAGDDAGLVARLDPAPVASGLANPVPAEVSS